MPQPTSLFSRPLASGIYAALLALLVSLVLCACAQRQIRDLPPLVRLSQIALSDGPARVQLRIENPNDIPMMAEQLTFSLELEGAEALEYDGPAVIDIVPQSAEEVWFELPLPAEVQQGMARLEQQQGISWRLEGELPMVEVRRWPFRSRGVLYPVPGVSGLYRASATGSTYPVRPPR
ncbi:MAG: hypothetical protein Tsb002_05710 [Wenzhouxiangellaceae bacterium]